MLCILAGLLKSYLFWLLIKIVLIHCQSLFYFLTWYWKNTPTFFLSRPHRNRTLTKFISLRSRLAGVYSRTLPRLFIINLIFNILGLASRKIVLFSPFGGPLIRVGGFASDDFIVCRFLIGVPRLRRGYSWVPFVILVFIVVCGARKQGKLVSSGRRLRKGSLDLTRRIGFLS